MNNQDKPRLAEVLGVEVGEKIRICGGCYHTVEFWIEKHGFPSADVCPALIYAINHPEGIIRVPRLTEPEIAIMRAVGAKWVSRDEGFDDVFLWSDKPKVTEDNEGYYISSKLGDCITNIRARLFPSVHPGDCIELKE